VLRVVREVQVVPHPVEDAALNGLEAVAGVGEGAGRDDRQGVGQVPAPGLVGEGGRTVSEAVTPVRRALGGTLSPPGLRRGAGGHGPRAINRGPAPEARTPRETQGCTHLWTGEQVFGQTAPGPDSRPARD